MTCNSTKSYMRVDNNGIYIMRFSVIYTTASGQTITLNSVLIEYGSGLRIEYPADAVSVRLKIDVEIFVDVFKTFLDKTYTTTEKRCFVTSGASLTPFINQVPCPKYDDSYVRVECAGFYFMWFYVIYTTPDGKTTSLISKQMGIGDKITLYYPPNITQVRVIVQIEKFIGVYSNIYDATFYKADRICLQAFGTVFGAGVNRFPCFV